MMKTINIIAIILWMAILLQSCATVKKIEDTIGIVKERVEKLDKKVEAIDTNKDGKWSLEEIMAFFGVPAGGLLILIRNMLSNKRKTLIENDVKNLKEAIAAAPDVPTVV